MKKKYLFILTFAIFVILMLLSTGEVKAATTYQNTDLYVRTTIERWNYHYKDLVFTKYDDWGGSGTNDWYTKTVWLTNSASGDPEEIAQDSDWRTECIEIEESYFDENNKVSLDSGHFSTSFDENETVYLVEKYHINTSSGNLSYTIGEWNTNNALPCRDRLDFSFDYSSGIAQTIKETSMNEYNPQNSYTVYIKALYDTDDVTANDRGTIVYFNLENSETKTLEKSQGTINLPVYAIKVDLTARGNVMEAGKFAVGRAFPSDGDWSNWGEVFCDDSDLGITSSVGRATGYILDSYDSETNENMNFQGISNRTINDFYIFYNANGDIWDFYDNESWIGYLDRSDFSLSSLVADSTLPNTYVRTISGTYENNQTAPNGIFYNILPFTIAGIAAIAGIVLLKKNSIKE
ncbi:MAG: hypothetical protein IJH12_05530 [Clostridia bacterium]|nr:hypothetical protein [Clostridia bacterium]